MVALQRIFPAAVLLTVLSTCVESHRLLPRRVNVTSQTGTGPEGPRMQHVDLLMAEKGADETATPQEHACSIIFGLILFVFSLSIQWFNEERSAKIQVLLVRGMEECVSLDANSVLLENRGRLVHVQGQAIGRVPVRDFQFQDAVVKDCLKLQSTLEVFEWVPSSAGLQAKSMPRFATEWTTTHRDPARSRQPAPKNPRLPGGLFLGTATSVCERAELGNFALKTDLLQNFTNFEPALQRLPSTVTAAGVTFYANPKDGFFYARPGFQAVSEVAKAELFKRHQEGDLRVRFLCVPSCDATVVAVQCHKDGQETFVPYRIVARPPCRTSELERLKLVEEGERPLQEIRRESTCCTGGVASCCCCPCNTIACFTAQEVVTEEIFYISDKLEPPEKPFSKAVGRNPVRVWSHRFLGWLATYLAVSMFLRPFELSFSILSSFGSSAPTIIFMMITLGIWGVVIAAAYACYHPNTAVRLFLAVGVVVGIPLVWDKLSS
eukprot:TRINITY_DN47169_c0_g1_i1.p1 TRINITY_DN47169_c0_g1~~TRINITY_DN47169_c0_g1_i1.p1  ORF type:complete len:493 (-),score=106.01 TRINITY_DN47169_c0_g1_i1:38-1516(-)